MKDILALYAELDEPLSPVVCFDESPYQLASEVRQPLPVAPGQPGRYDDDYRREGTCNLFMCCEPRQGWRHVKVTDRRTTQDLAHWMKELVEIHVPTAAVISVVLDNLHTPTPGALYATFPPAEACRLVRKLDFHYTPPHGSGLNMAEIEFVMVVTQCLDRRLGNPETVRREVAAWEARRHAAKAIVDWRVTTTKARRKLKHVYP
jgi:DDE superfamily endonuclease